SVYRPPHPLPLPSFPTRRSSDLSSRTRPAGATRAYSAETAMRPRPHAGSAGMGGGLQAAESLQGEGGVGDGRGVAGGGGGGDLRSAEHTSGLQSPTHPVIRPLL